MAPKKSTKKKQKSNNVEIMLYVYVIIIITISLIGILESGFLGYLLANVSEFIFGTYYIVFFVLCLIYAVTVAIKRKWVTLASKRALGVIIVLMSLLLILSIPSNKLVGKSAFDSFIKLGPNIFEGLEVPVHGGVVGAVLYFLTSSAADITGTWVVVVALMVLGGLLLFDRQHFSKLFTAVKTVLLKPIAWFKGRKKTRKTTTTVAPDYEADLIDYRAEIKFNDVGSDKAQGSFSLENEVNNDPPVNEEVVTRNVPTVETARYDDYSDYRLPPIGRLLERNTYSKSKNNELAAKAKGRHLIEILEHFQIPAQLVDTFIGPSVTKFVIKPDIGIKVNRIMNIQDNIKMELAAKNVRIEAPIPGRNGVGIEIPNVETTPVRMKDVFDSMPENLKNKKLAVALGKDLLGNPIYCELDNMPHLLIAGATGSGKSVCMNSIICSLLLRTTPAELKLLLIDPKKVEFTQYHQVPHLIGPVISDCLKAASALEVIVNKMDARYDKFQSVAVRNITEFNTYARTNPNSGVKPLPFIVVVIDELADLMSVAGKEVEARIQRITQMARAAGIHLVVATQRPSTDVITGIIKTNIPSRIAFAVSSGIDSRTILDQIGAERLLGNGDMLYTPLGEPLPKRLQGVYVTDKEINNITSYVSSQAKPFFEDEFVNGADANQDGYGSTSADPMYDEVVKFVIAEQKASTSLLQRRFGFGYNRAARIIDVLQQQGIIGPAQGSKPREVYKKSLDNKEVR